MATVIPINMSVNKIDKTAYVVLRYSFAVCISPFAFASAKRFRNPCAKPKSKKDSQEIMELSVSQIPYLTVSMYPMVRGTTCRDINILMHFSPNDAIIFFFAKTVLSLPFKRKD